MVVSAQCRRRKDLKFDTPTRGFLEQRNPGLSQHCLPGLFGLKKQCMKKIISFALTVVDRVKAASNVPAQANA